MNHRSDGSENRDEGEEWESTHRDERQDSCSEQVHELALLRIGRVRDLALERKTGFIDGLFSFVHQSRASTPRRGWNCSRCVRGGFLSAPRL